MTTAEHRFLPFIRNRADFDDATTRLMGDAFDAARASLEGQAEPELFYEIIAARIVEAAMKGERDLTALRDAGLAAFGYKSDLVSSSTAHEGDNVGRLPLEGNQLLRACRMRLLAGRSLT
jgi:hypothetical protein